MKTMTNQDLANVTGGRSILQGKAGLIYDLKNGHASGATEKLLERMVAAGAAKGGAEVLKPRGWLKGDNIANYLKTMVHWQ